MLPGGRWLVAGAALLAVLAGCEAPPQRASAPATFYPAAPQAPRLQFLVGYSGEQDLGGTPNKFAAFVVGKEPVRKPINKPYGLALHDGKIYVCDTGSAAIDIIDLRTREFRYFTPGGEGKLVTPVNIAIDHDGTRYVADPASGQVLIYGRDDSFLGAIGERVSGKGRAHSPASVAPVRAESTGSEAEMKPTDVLVAGDRLYVADLKNHYVRVYDKAKRQLLFTIPRAPATADAQSKLFAPANLAVDAQGRVYVSDLGAFRILQYSPDGQFLRQFGRGVGDKPGEFARPKGVAVDREGRVYVVDAATQVVQIFDPDGRLLLFFGDRQGSTPGLDLPAKVVIDYDHNALFASHVAPDFQLEYLVIVTNQFGEHKVSVFGFGHKK